MVSGAFRVVSEFIYKLGAAISIILRCVGPRRSEYSVNFKHLYFISIEYIGLRLCTIVEQYVYCRYVKRKFLIANVGIVKSKNLNGEKIPVGGFFLNRFFNFSL